MKFIASPLEMIAFVMFVFYLVFQIETPNLLVPYIDSSMGMVAIVVITLYLFLYTHPILGVLSIFVSYEVLRRSTTRLTQVKLFEPNPVQHKVDQEMKAMNPPKDTSLEEVMVSKMAPMPKNTPNDFIETSFKPVSESIHNASNM
jgi:hypothetical protein